MSAYERAVPVLQVAGVEISVRWYADVLSFTPNTFPANPPFSFAILRRDGAELMLQCGEAMRSSVRKEAPDLYGAFILGLPARPFSMSLLPLRVRPQFCVGLSECFTV
jgi:hypothetical protein